MTMKIRALLFGVALMLVIDVVTPFGQEGNKGSGTMPTVVRSVKAVYTPEGRRAHIEGIVVLHAIVQPDGRVSDVKVFRSLDSTFGLDEQAVKATRQWLFKPAVKDGKPVAASVTIEQDFHLNSTR
jgi:protein TonB